MSKRLYHTMSWALVLSVLTTLVAQADLVDHWRFDESSGSTARNSVAGGVDGTVDGATWVNDPTRGRVLSFDGIDDVVNMIGYKGITGSASRTVTLWFQTDGTGGTGPNGRGLIGWGTPAGSGVRWEVVVNKQGSPRVPDALRFNASSGTRTGETVVADGLWHHVAVTMHDDGSPTSDEVYVYLDGVEEAYSQTNGGVAVNTGTDADVRVGLGSREEQNGFFAGLIDDVRIYDHALTPEEILAVMQDSGAPELARSPMPGHETVDVLNQGTVLTWEAGRFAESHDLYWGLTFDDVNNASTDDAAYLGRQAEAGYALDALDFGQTYYWRVDEVNGAPDRTVFKGEVWRFEVEPFAIPVANILATASSAHDADMVPEKTIDGSGLDELDQHSTEGTDMWLSGMGDAGPSIQYEFDQAYKLHEMWVWNSNQLIENFVGLGAKDVSVEVSTDGTDWTVLTDQAQFAQAPGKAGYAHNSTIDLGGTLAKFVKLNILAGHGMLPQNGLSEVRFFYIPTLAREPQPMDGVVTDTVDVVLNWRAGREAALHEVYLGTDMADLALIQTVNETSATIGPLDYATTYYWQIVEVNDAEDPASYAGDIWSFSTPAYGIVDNFDQYNDDCNRIFFAWLDGLGHNGGEDVDNCNVASFNGNGTGSIVGNASSPFAEQSIVYAGRQSMPLEYDSGVSETTIALVPQDWTASGIQSLALHIYGGPGNTGQLYLKINSTKVSYAGLPDILQREQWTPWNIDLAGTGAGLSNVTTLTLGIENASGPGIIYVDEIRLYPLAPETIDPVVPDASDPSLVAYYEFEGNANDTKGNYPGTVEGDPTYTAGKVGQAINLDEIDDNVVHALAQETIWPAYTVSLWVKTDLMGQDTNSSLFNNNSSSSDFQIEVDGNDDYLYRGSANGIIGPVSKNWIHVGVSCDGTRTHLYYNGLLSTSLNVADTNFGQLAVGINRGMANRFGGVIDEVKVYDRPLSHGEIAGLAGITEAFDKPFAPE